MVSPSRLLLAAGLFVAVPGVAQSPPDSVARARRILDRITDEIPAMVRTLPASIPANPDIWTPARDTGRAIEHYYSFLYSGFRTVTPEYAHYNFRRDGIAFERALDSLDRLSVPTRLESRAFLLLARKGAAGIASALAEELTRGDTYLRQAERFEAAIRVAVTAVRRAGPVVRAGAPGVTWLIWDDYHGRQTMVSELEASANTVGGAVSLAKGDTTRAVRLFLAAAQSPAAPNPRVPAITAARLSAGKSSLAAEHLLATTIAYLQTPTLTVRDSLYRELQTLYPAMALGTKVPDIEAGLEEAPERDSAETLDRYLDRQFRRLFDFELGVSPLMRSPVTGRSRFVIGEFLTGVF